MEKADSLVGQQRAGSELAQLRQYFLHLGLSLDDLDKDREVRLPREGSRGMNESVASVTLDRAKHDRSERTTAAKKLDDCGVERLPPVPVGLVHEDSQQAAVFKIVHVGELARRARGFPAERVVPASEAMRTNARFADVEYLLDGFEHVETVQNFRDRLKLGRPLNVKLGIDPTSPDLHLGFMVVLSRLQRFAEAGHNVTLIIGDFTARIGDPSGRNTMRPQLDAQAIEANMKTYREQAGKVLDLERVRLRYNSEWLDKLDAADLVRLLSKTTVAQMLERNDFHDRYASGTPILLHEFLYPVAQAYDSMAIEADVELGGSDQLFNLLLGRHYQRESGQLPQICATVPLLVGLDGVKKMSKSLDNYVGIAEDAQTQFGKLMSVGDDAMPAYARLAAFRSQAAADALQAGLSGGTVNPMQEKKRLAEDVVALYHGAAAAKSAREYFERTVQRKEIPDDLTEIDLGDGKRVADALLRAGFAKSRREAERLISARGVKLDGIVVEDPRAPWPAAVTAVLSVGSRKFVRVRTQP